MQALKRDGADAEFLADQPADQYVQGFAGVRKDESGLIRGPVQLEACGLRRDPDLTRRAVGADHDLREHGFFDFERQNAFLVKDLDIVLFREDIESPVQCFKRAGACLGENRRVDHDTIVREYLSIMGD